MTARAAPLLSILLATALLAGCTGTTEGVVVPSAAPQTGGDLFTRESINGTAGSVGGVVTNSAPRISTFTPSATTGENRGAFAVVFSGTAFDPNTELQIAQLEVAATGAGTLQGTHVVTMDERRAASEPASYGADGFKVWSGEANDGILHFKFRQAFPAFSAVGDYAFTARVIDLPGLSGASPPVTVTLTAFSDITISSTPVDASGAALPGQNWGQWNAEAGAKGVAATNYLKLVNTGDTAGARVVIDFDNAFVGASDANFTIPVAGNVEFAWFEDVSPAATAPSEGVFTYAPASGEGSTTLVFTGKGNVVYVSYRIKELPQVLPVQSYGIAFTVTEL